MIDHLGFGVSDLAASKRFFVAALAPLGIAVVMEGEHGVGLGKNGGPTLTLSTKRRSLPAARTTALRACARTTIRTTTAPSLSTPTVTTSKRFATGQKRRTSRHWRAIKL